MSTIRDAHMLLKCCARGLEHVRHPAGTLCSGTGGSTTPLGRANRTKLNKQNSDLVGRTCATHPSLGSLECRFGRTHALLRTRRTHALLRLMNGTSGGFWRENGGAFLFQTVQTLLVQRGLEGSKRGNHQDGGNHQPSAVSRLGSTQKHLHQTPPQCTLLPKAFFCQWHSQFPMILQGCSPQLEGRLGGGHTSQTWGPSTCIRCSPSSVSSPSSRRQWRTLPWRTRGKRCRRRATRGCGERCGALSCRGSGDPTGKDWPCSARTRRNGTLTSGSARGPRRLQGLPLEGRALAVPWRGAHALSWPRAFRTLRRPCTDA